MMRKIGALLLAVVLAMVSAGCSPEVIEGTEITQAELNTIFSQEYEEPKNVIVMIGDGMGPNDLILAERFNEECYEFGLVLNQIPHHGLTTTHSADSEVTDSAAAATALATGTKTDNGVIGMNPDLEPLKNITEIARENYKKVGIVTTDYVTGATPAAFTVHNESRDNTGPLADALVELAPDVLIGQCYEEFSEVLSESSKKALEKIHVAEDFRAIEESISSDPEKPFFGFIDLLSTKRSDYILADCTEAALSRLKNENGFFLMVENSGTDKAGHANDINGKINSVVTFDRAVAAALRFMKEKPDTLLIITSDHETGGVTLPEGEAKPTDKLYTTDGHTDTPVRVFAVGQGAEYFHNKTVDNTDIAKFVINAVSVD